MIKRCLILFLILISIVGGVVAQEATPEPPTSEVTDADVNAVASRIIYPFDDGGFRVLVEQGITITRFNPLSECSAVACDVWREDIRSLLEQGLNGDEIRNVFAERYGPEAIIIVTADHVNDIANGMFCPVCENIPLDACGTAACDDWRDEIKLFLEQGMTEEEIRTDFVRRFGDRVVGVPQDPFLNALSVITPWVLVVIGLVVVFSSFRTWARYKSHAVANALETPTATPSAKQNQFLDQLEEDLKG